MQEKFIKKEELEDFLKEFKGIEKRMNSMGEDIKDIKTMQGIKDNDQDVTLSDEEELDNLEKELQDDVMGMGPDSSYDDRMSGFGRGLAQDSKDRKILFMDKMGGTESNKDIH